jgi:predicted GTPase
MNNRRKRQNGGTMTKFLEYRHNVLSVFDSCITFAEKNGYGASVNNMQDSRKKVEDNKLVILTCGEMKKGKSSLLTALLEDPGLFPVDIEVTTCLVTMVSYAEQEKITVILEDEDGKEQSQTITRDEISDYVTEQRNQHNTKNAKLILVETPNPRLKNGFVFVDTPGIGSLNPEHSQVTYSFLPRADVVLFISDATMPLTQPELNFLNLIKNYCSNVLYVLTKKDLVPDFQAIMDSNKQKIQEVTQIPQNKIMMVPVSSRAKLSYLETGKERLLKTSNFEMFEKLMWDVIYRNRATIIMFPPLKVLGGELKSINNDIYVHETASSGNADQFKELSDKLTALQEEKQSLLSNNSYWQNDALQHLKKVSLQTDTTIDSFMKDTLAYLNSQLKNPKNISNPQPLLSDIVGMLTNMSIQLQGQIQSELMTFKEAFEEKTSFNFQIEQENNLLNVDEVDFNLKTLSKLDKVVDGGRIISSTTFGLTSAATVAGGIIGAVLGLFGGVAGAIIGAQYGATIGGTLGGAVGTVKGTSRVLKDPAYHTEPQVRNEITRYIQTNCMSWKKSTSMYLSNIQASYIESLKFGIETSKKQIDDNISLMKVSMERTKTELAEDRKKFQLIRQEFNNIMAGYTKILQVNVADDSERPEIRVANPVEKEEGPNLYSHLEE